MTDITETVDVYDRFEKEYFQLNPKGNILSAWTNLIYQVNNDIKNAHGDRLVLEDLIESYQKYLIYWKRSFAQQDEKFISKENKLMDPESFIMTRSYQSIWNATRTTRDEYLFGDTSESYRDTKLTEFTDGIPKLPKKVKRK